MVLSKFQKTLIVYTLFIILGIVGTYLSKQGIIINSMDILISETGMFIAPIAIIISLLYLHKIVVLKEVKEMPIWGKVLLHSFSVVFIGWGIIGALIIINKTQGKDAQVTLSVKITDAYSRAPKNDYKYSYSYTRYYIKFIDVSTKKNYRIQVREDFYNSALIQKAGVENTQMFKQNLSTETIKFMKENNVKLDEPKQYVELTIPIGALGFWE